jgi:beta-fructofuranosidase
LYKYNGTKWEYQGLFFSGTSQAAHGRFWEMPNVTPLAGGKYLFTCTPLDIAGGVHKLYWIGTIGADGKFTPDQTTAQTVEMEGVLREGYGLLSPTIAAIDGKLLMLGIVPDKLATEHNYNMGWAHLYSLPRELTVSASGKLEQKPFGGLTAMRTTTTFTKEETINGNVSLSPVSGRQIELLGEFDISSGQCGFRFLKSGDNQATLTYDADTRQLTLDLTAMARIKNDETNYNGKYTIIMTEQLKKLHLFLDGSIADIFVNDTQAFSVRLFPTDANAVEAEVFTTTAVPAKVSAWTLDASQTTGISEIVNSERSNRTRYALGSSRNCYDLQGRILSDTPQRGLYIKNGKKYVAR